MFKRPVEYAGPGDRVATLFSGLDPDQIERGIIC
jgi:translation elongation factor EF-Tu-like GTPase